MEPARKIRTLVVASTATLALALPIAVAHGAEAETVPTPGATIEQPTEGPLEQGATLAPPSEEEGAPPPATGGTNAGDGTPQPD
ncbi:MAG TPA: hypothetical protein VG458_06085, partial [Solirubrobacterales bacterium]|nr:hypothetical protein [Solirubrobacterales bacterium]